MTKIRKIIKLKNVSKKICRIPQDVLKKYEEFTVYKQPDKTKKT